MTATHDLLDRIDLAVELTEKGNLTQAEPIYLSCLDTLSATLGDNHPDTISCTSNLGLLYMSQKQWSKALPWLIRCVEGKKSTIGSDHSSTLGSLTNLGIVHKNLRQYEEAEQCYNQALAGRTAQCGTDAPETLTVINNLATLYSEQQLYEAAQPLLSSNMTRYSLTSTSYSPSDLSFGMFSSCSCSSTCVVCLESRRRVLGNGHSDTLASVNNLAVLCYRMGESHWEDAVVLYEECLQGRRLLLGDGHLETLATM